MTGTLVQSNLDKIGDFLQDAQYQSLMVNSASYNVRIMRERKARMPFLDSQTGLAQSPLRPPLLPRHRLPPTASRTHTPGQLYRYPALPWRRRHRSYLARQHQQWLQRKAAMEAEASEHTILTMENPAAGSQGLPIGDDLLDKDAFFYEESVGFLDDDEDDLDNDDDDFDDDTYGMRSSKRRRGSKHVKRSKGGFRGGGRKRRDAVGGPTPPAGRTPTADPDEINAKPYECQRCSARYKTRQGLSYHLSHTHKTDAASNTAAAAAAAAAAASAVAATPTTTGGAPPDAASPALSAPKGDVPPTDSDTTLPSTPPAPDPPPTPEPTKAGVTDHSQSSYENSFKDYLNAAGANTPIAPSKKGGRSRKNSNASTASSASNPAPSSAADSSRPTEAGADEADPRNRTTKQNTFVATPNPYCDFCLGDSRYNKKTGAPEQMVSCSDCGRSGHPSCLQFTARMMEAVKRYRWQCIECKCCTLCGTAENDDQLLFCDDCDRGYHLYCVRPPLAEPPEGEWACHMCSLTTAN